MNKELTIKLKSNYHQYVRVWKLLKRPTMAEFITISKVSVIGLLAIGAFGFVISIAMKTFI
ncbi:MAG: protein translocase SEC61 complex subunit gamma [Nanoarchaeota archaeon]|nr:protein translocase SEC61 complex subunit gamma [Nanoarchaeota archaeon]